jgi:hypothetical protein
MPPPTHRLFVFIDAEYEAAFTRGYEDARQGRALPPAESHSVEFTIDAGNGPRRGALAITLLPPLAEARFEGHRMGQAGARTIDDLRDVVASLLRRFRATPHLRFQVVESEDPAFSDAELERWNTLTTELVAEGVPPTAPIAPLAFVPIDSTDTVSAIATRDEDLRFPIALPATTTSVTLTVRLGSDERVLVYALP